MANSDLIGSLVRAMEILKMIGDSPSGCRVEEICAAMKLKPPTVYNIIRTLVAGGFVERHNRSLRLGRSSSVSPAWAREDCWRRRPRRNCCRSISGFRRGRRSSALPRGREWSRPIGSVSTGRG
ncbi:MAG: helix-turn-helix domain-containing protein [Lentisphaeria bacterium]|nr:MAG: helix-turn-helix domain-containing protein [Lentisphaeria bacterium]